MNSRSSKLFREEVDKFTKKRPWWIVKSESYFQSPNITKTIKDSQNSTFESDIVLDRYHPSFDSFLNFITNIHYLSKSLCEQNPIIIGRKDCIHPGWGSVTEFYSTVQKGHPYAIFSVFWPHVQNPDSNKYYPSDRNAFHNGKGCHDINLWNCAFLSTTNCTIPNVIRECNMRNCLDEETKHFAFTIVLNSSSENGAIITGTDYETGVQLGNKYGRLPINKFQRDYELPQPTFKYILSYQNITNTLPDIDPWKTAYIFLFLLRLNSFYRSKVAELLNHFYKKIQMMKLNIQSNCVSIHIRRGDRTKNIPGLNMTEWCYNATLPPQPNHINMCLDVDQTLTPCSRFSLADFGCYNRIQFGSLSLSFALTKVESIIGPTITNIIVFSDDIPWLEQEVKTHQLQQSKWSVHYLSPPKALLKGNVFKNTSHFESMNNHMKDDYYYHYVRSDAATESGIYFHSSLQLTQQCIGFVGHFGSAGTKMFYQSMCVKHGDTMGLCPSVYDLQWG